MSQHTAKIKVSGQNSISQHTSKSLIKTKSLNSLLSLRSKLNLSTHTHVSDQNSINQHTPISLWSKFNISTHSLIRHQISPSQCTDKSLFNKSTHQCTANLSIRHLCVTHRIEGPFLLSPIPAHSQVYIYNWIFHLKYSSQAFSPPPTAQNWNSKNISYFSRRQANVSTHKCTATEKTSHTSVCHFSQFIITAGGRGV